MSQARSAGKRSAVASRGGSGWRVWLAGAALLVFVGFIAWTMRGKPDVAPAAPPVAAAAAVGEPVFAATVAAAASPGPAPAGMVWIPGGEFSMGAADPRGCAHGGHDADGGRAADPPRRRGRLLDGRDRGDERAVRALREGDRLRDRRRAQADARGLPGRAARRTSWPGSVVFTPAAGAGAARQPLPVVELRARARLAASRRARRATCADARSTRSCTSPTRTPKPTRSGRASGCPRRRSGSSRRAAA